ncbi:D-alanyl-D-alanine carboxypeptidase (penicillin-binding protein 5/6) [Caloranaerobacter azorensis DSM 13643]|uniref:serine-type D-Ala-D-Ala carboxypeptidase n=1 Tax=Caloranaerobacter azorensis DSM 13643 TaxID=1121264 RepID=A0A1M5TBQ9_9FIRM|nr:D-alanyl-D-alanine carboxypeptidase family protein [Caloranaerobacter azorensis]SHH48149.1 D-alanyl-D-alanine carboxypeptidase (penicillin-binding protein 5/6) [Caloranaerobacter azorensis DSM 13643]
MHIKRIFSVIIMFILIFNSLMCFADSKFDIQAKSAILIDALSGKVIYEKNPHEKLAPASITKIMVLLLAMEALESNKIKLDDEVIISSNASSMGGSQIYLEEGEQQTVEDLIKSICLRSANDAAVALGEHIAGSEEIFIEMMNNKAKELGMEDTSFKNITGLDEEGHYTSAYDVSIMSKELLKHKKIHQWLTLWMSSIKVGKEKDVIQNLVNTNRLIHDYKGANGIKTGFTRKAGYCLSASATRGNLTLISVVMGCKNSSIRFRESKKLLDYGFANYQSIILAKKGTVVGKIPIQKGKVESVEVVVESDLNYLAKKGSSINIEKEVILPSYINAPVSKDSKVGEIIYKVGEKEIGRVNLIIKEDINKASVKDSIRKIFRTMLGTI